jgi:hypothetical protein
VRRRARQGVIRSVLCGTVVGCPLAPTASAATLVGDYQFQSTEASSGPGPVLTETGGGGPTSFQNENVMGTSRQVLTFPEGTGLSMSPSVGTGDVPYSVDTTFRFTDVNDYNRILDATEGSADQGFYDSSGTADIFGVSEASSTTIPFTNNAYATVALTSLPSAESRFYVNGAFAVNLNESFPVSAGTLRFFKDDGSGLCRAVSCIRVYTVC